MLDFIYDLYKNDHFTLYLTIILVVLVILFFIVLLYGKKDQKLEETKKLQKLAVDGFKEEDKAAEKVEVAKEETKDEVKAETPPVVEESDELPALKEEKPAEEVNAPEKTVVDEVSVTEFEPSEPLTKDESEELIALLNDDNEPKIPEIKFDEDGLKKDLQELEDIKNKFDQIEVKKVEAEEPKKENSVGTPVFSSVFVEKDEELPTMKETPASPAPTNTFMVDDDDEDMDLPSLK